MQQFATAAAAAELEVDAETAMHSMAHMSRS